MFSHVQTSGDTFVRLIPAGTPVVWDASNFCTVDALERDGKADRFGVKPFYTAAKPIHDPIRQGVREADPVAVGGQWTQQWVVYDLDDATVAANIAAHDAAELAAAKAARQALVDAIVVTTASGKAFDGDERSQDRISRAITCMDDGDTVPWVLHDNTVVIVDRAELREALRLAGAEMATIWVSIYES